MVALTIRSANETPVVTAGPGRVAGSEVAGLPGRRRTVRLGAEEIERLLEGYRLGVPVRGLAAEFGIDRSTVILHVKRAGVATRTEAVRWDNDTLARAIAIYEAGALCREIAERLGVHKSTVARRLVEAGVVMRRG